MEWTTECDPKVSAMMQYYMRYNSKRHAADSECYVPLMELVRNDEVAIFVSSIEGL